MYLPSAFGVLVVTLLNMFTSTRNKVIRRPIRPGITSGGTTKLIQETTTKRPIVWELQKKKGLVIQNLCRCYCATYYLFIYKVGQ